MTQPPIAWKRVRRALFQHARRQGIAQNQTEQILDQLPQLIEMCGPFSHGRKPATAIGKALLTHTRPQIIVPICPAYTHRRGRYTYRGLGEGVPLLVKQHVPFVQAVEEVLGEIQVHLLIARQEAHVPELCRAIGVDSDTFCKKVNRSIAATRRLIAPYGWSVDAMEEVVPGLDGPVEAIAQELRTNAKTRTQLIRETRIRAPVYEKIGYPRRRFFDRTVHTAAQYIHLGRFATRHGYLIVNHTTLNLAWYARERAPFLHNPVQVYASEVIEPPSELVS